MIFVTEATGLVGSHLVCSLLKQGKEVRALKRKDSSLEAIKRVFNYRLERGDELFRKIEWVEANIRNYEKIDTILKDIKEVYHTAAIVSFNRKLRHEMFDINVGGTEALVELSMKNGIEKFCFVSSTSTLGQAGEGGMVSEESFWRKSRNTTWYSWTKFNSELEVWKGIAGGLNACIVNPSIIIGPGDWTRGSGKMISTIASGQKFYTGGRTGFVDIRDVVDVMIMLMDRQIFGERFILNSGNLDYIDVFKMISSELGLKAPYLRANRYLTSLAWRLEAFFSMISKRTPLLSREIARSSHSRIAFSNEKIIKALDMKFIPVEESIRDACKAYTIDSGLS